MTNPVDILRDELHESFLSERALNLSGSNSICQAINWWKDLLSHTLYTYIYRWICINRIREKYATSLPLLAATSYHFQVSWLILPTWLNCICGENWRNFQRFPHKYIYQDNAEDKLSSVFTLLATSSLQNASASR